MAKCQVNNKNLWSGKFKEKELKLYEVLKQKDIDVILEYQKLLPILQEDNEMKIDARELYKELVVGSKTKKDGTKTKGSIFSNWIKRRIEKYDFVENEDYFKIYGTPSKPVISYVSKFGNVGLEQKIIEEMTPQKRSYYGITEEFYITLEMAKELCMIENNNVGRTSRKYFIAIEKAFKYRVAWNKDRKGSIDAYYNLREIVFKDLYTDNRLGDFIPKWWNITETKTGRKNSYAYELYRLDLVIIGMSAQEYRKINNLNKGIAIRNTFTEEQLEDFELLQSKSAEYLYVNKIYNTEERMNLLHKFYKYYKEINY